MRTLLGTKPDGTLAPFPVPVNGKLAGIQEHRIKKAKKERQKAQREYKANLKELKKKVPLAERAKINVSRFPEKYL